MFNEKNLLLAVQIILIVGAVNWGLVEQITGGGDVEKYVKYAVAAAGVYFAYVLFA